MKMTSELTYEDMKKENKQLKVVIFRFIDCNWYKTISAASTDKNKYDPGSGILVDIKRKGDCELKHLEE